MSMIDLWLLRAVTGISAFLLFQIELIIAKMFLPHYGGSYLVWGACIVFFQAALLAGYLFAHGLIPRCGVRRYRRGHLFLILLPLLFFPGRPLAVEPPGCSLPLALDVFLRLCLTIGPVFFVLSTVSIASQMWLSASSLSPRFNPYALYSTSNVGSFAALLSYPFVFEAHWDLPRQLWFWRVLYFLLIGLNIWMSRRIKITETAGHGREAAGEVIGFSRKARWFLLGAAGVIVFLSATNIITSEIVPAPLLWVIPLGLYLLSFVLNFRERPWCPPWIVSQIPFLLGSAALLFFLIEQRTFPATIALILLCGIQFVLCMYCQNRLFAFRPKTAGRLTSFYVIFSLGGFAGGLLTTWVIPLVSFSFIEYLAGLVVMAVTLVITEKKFHLDRRHTLWIIAMVLVVVTWPRLFPGYNFFGVLMIFMLFRFLFCFVFKGAPLAVVVSLVFLAGVAYYPFDLWNTDGGIYIKRNYYGISKLVDSDGIRSLYHGGTLHGAQYLAREKRGDPLAYYSPQLPAGEILSSYVFAFQRVGLIGLGTGALAAYADARQRVDFYELDPDIYFIAGRYFTYLRDSPGRINVVFGDARRSLENSPAARYDLLVVDAFGGDAVPFHLLTRESVALYRRHLNGNGILLFHISNRYLDLKNVLARVGASLGAHVGFKVGAQRSFVDIVSTWVVMTWDEDHFQTLRSRFQWIEPDPGDVMKTRLWTDQYINILPVVRLDQLLGQVRYFAPFYW